MNVPSMRHRFAGNFIVLLLFMGTASNAVAQSQCATPKDLFVNPFNKNSAFHRPIGTGAIYAGEGHPTTLDWRKASTLSLNVGGPWGVDVARVTASDPIKTVIGRPPSRNLPASVRFPAGGFPTTRAPTASSDNLTFIYNASEERVFELYGYDWNGGNPSAQIMWNWDIRGLGHGTRAGQRVGSMASGIASAAGLVRGETINSSGRPIEHALQIGIPSKPNCNAMLSRAAILPATLIDGFATRPGYNSGSIPYGANMAIPRNVEVKSLGLSEPGVRIAQALQNYGAYVVDTAGCGQGAIRFDQFVNGQIRSQLRNDMPKIYRHMRMIINSEWRSGEAAVGGGTPLAPNCAFDAGAAGTPSAGQSSPQTAGSSVAGGTPPTASVSTISSSDSGGSSTGSSSEPLKSAGGNTPPTPSTTEAANWAKAVQFYRWAASDKRTMERTTPGTAAHDKAKRDYERNISNYIRLAGSAGITVTADIAPDRAFN